MRKPRLCYLLLAIVLLLTSTRCIQNMSTSELGPHLFKTRFNNGLTAIVKETPGTKVATVQIWVKAGSVYEEPGEAGITHLIEHMIFKGTPSLGPGEVAETIEGFGGRINAYTSYEYTVYHATLSSRYWEKTMEVLTDAVLHSTFDPDELEREKKVVLEEIGMRRDRPTTRLFEKLMANAYAIHPYRLPIIGTQESVSSFTRQDILNYMAKHYQPENFTLVVVGDVDADDVTAKALQLMGDLSRGDRPRLLLPKEPAQQQTRLFTIKEDIQQTHLAMAFPITPFDDPQTPALDVLAHILGQGETSRLYNQLRNKKGLVYRIDGFAFTPRDAGLLEIMATLDAANVQPALVAILEEIFRLKYQPVSVEELIKAKLNLESDFIFGLEQVEGQARTIGSFEFLTDDPREKEYLDRLRGVTADDVMRAARTYFSGNRLTAGAILPKDSKLELADEFVAASIKKAEDAASAPIRQKPTGVAPVAGSYLPNVYRFTLDNGLRVIVREDHEVPTVAIRAVFPGGLRGETPVTNGAFAFISELLPKGTETLTARQVALKVANMAGDLEGFNGKNTFGIKGDFLARFFEDGLQLVRDIILTPAFDHDEAEKIRPELLAQLKNQEDSLPALAMREFNRLLFRDHPYGLNTSGNEDAIRHLTTDKLKELYLQHASPKEMVLTVSGDVTPEKVRAVTARFFGTWQPVETPPPAAAFAVPQPPPKPERFSQARDKAQAHIIIGFLGAGFASDDRFALEMLDAVLSGQSGRLFTELRDKQSLAYSLSSFAQPGIDTGAFGVYIGTSPDKKEAAIKELWHQLRLVRDEKVTPAELQRARNVLIGQYELGLQTHGSQAMDFALLETYGLGLDFGNRYIAALEKITAADLLAAARKYIQPDHYVMIAIGPDKKSKK